MVATQGWLNAIAIPSHGAVSVKRRVRAAGGGWVPGRACVWPFCVPGGGHVVATAFVAVMVFCSYTSRLPTWDESKRLANIRKHALDFEGCEVIFDGPVVVDEDARDRYGEVRLNATGWFDGRVVIMTYTERDDDFHVISLREAKKHEIRRYIKEISR